MSSGSTLWGREAAGMRSEIISSVKQIQQGLTYRVGRSESAVFLQSVPSWVGRLTTYITTLTSYSMQGASQKAA